MIPFFFSDTVTGTFTFSPPIRSFTEPWRKETPMSERRFFAHFRGSERAVNVYQLLDGSFTETDGLRPEEYIRVFRGATVTPVDDATAVLLQAAGYEVQFA